MTPNFCTQCGNRIEKIPNSKETSWDDVVYECPKCGLQTIVSPTEPGPTIHFKQRDWSRQ